MVGNWRCCEKTSFKTYLYIIYTRNDRWRQWTSGKAMVNPKYFIYSECRDIDRRILSIARMNYTPFRTSSLCVTTKILVFIRCVSCIPKHIVFQLYITLWCENDMFSFSWLQSDMNPCILWPQTWTWCMLSLSVLICIEIKIHE